MEQQSSVQQPIKHTSKSIIMGGITILILLVAAVSTKLGYIPNFLDIGFLCSEKTANITSEYIENSYEPPAQNDSQYDSQAETITSDPWYTPDSYELSDWNDSQSHLKFGSRLELQKPVIYLYPEQKQQVRVKLHYQGNLTVTYPEYKSGWNVMAYPDGKIVDLTDNKEYSYLFWEGEDTGAIYDTSSGFVVKWAETAQFLQETLAKFGLTPREYNEFIVYWLPQMLGNKYNLIHFATKREYDDRAVLDIIPKPDSLLRVFMAFQKLDTEIKVAPQEIHPFVRNGFSVVEWGGTEIK